MPRWLTKLMENEVTFSPLPSVNSDRIQPVRNFVQYSAAIMGA